MLENPNNYCKYYWLKITSILNILIFFSLLLTVAIIKTTTLNQIFNISPSNNSWQFYSLKIFLILILILILGASTLWVAISFKKKWILEIQNNAFFSFFLTVLTLNFYGCFFTVKLIHDSKSTDFNKKFWTAFKQKIGIKQWLTIDYILIAFFCSITLVFAYIEENLLPRMPFGGGIAIKYIPLIIISFTTSFLGGWLTGFISAFISILFIPATNIINPWNFLLDYFLPMTTPAIVALLPFKLNSNKSIFTYIGYFFHCFLVLLIIYFWQFLSGYLLWTTAFPDSVWTGYSAVWYSLIYNFIHIFLFSYPIIQIIVPILYRSLGNYYFNRYH
ncbi:MAG: energy-coupled thiamine transporter ThiT [Spiroplasma sp.]